jgi:predicted dehydrogenase
MTETFVKQRKHSLTGKVEKVGIDDASAFLARFSNGSLATFESTRYARGHKALYTFEINGEHGSIAWDLHDLHRLQYFEYKDEGRVRGWRNLHITDSDHPYMKNWWVPGLAIGYEHSFVHQVADFIQGIETASRLARPSRMRWRRNTLPMQCLSRLAPTSGRRSSTSNNGRGALPCLVVLATRFETTTAVGPSGAAWQPSLLYRCCRLLISSGLGLVYRVGP